MTVSYYYNYFNSLYIHHIINYTSKDNKDALMTEWKSLLFSVRCLFGKVLCIIVGYPPLIYTTHDLMTSLKLKFLYCFQTVNNILGATKLALLPVRFVQETKRKGSYMCDNVICCHYNWSSIVNEVNSVECWKCIILTNSGHRFYGDYFFGAKVS